MLRKQLSHNVDYLLDLFYSVGSGSGLYHSRSTTLGHLNEKQLGAKE
jgi:hypothetical protein